MGWTLHQPGSLWLFVTYGNRLRYDGGLVWEVRITRWEMVTGNQATRFVDACFVLAGTTCSVAAAI